MAARRVASKTALRTTAWTAAAAALVGSWGVLGWLPKPEPAVAIERSRARKVVVVKKKLLRRVIVVDPTVPASPPAVSYVPAAPPSSSPPLPAPISTGGS